MLNAIHLGHELKVELCNLPPGIGGGACTTFVDKLSSQTPVVS